MSQPSEESYEATAQNLEHPAMRATRELLWPRRYQSPGGFAGFRQAAARLFSELIDGTSETSGENKSNLPLGGAYPGVVRLLQSESPVFYVKKHLAEDLLKTEPPADEDIHSMEWPHPDFLLFIPQELNLGFDIVLLSKFTKGETIGMDWPGWNGQIHNGDRQIIPADLVEVVCWDSHNRNIYITFLGIDESMNASRVDFQSLSTCLHQQDAPNRDSVKLAVSTLFFLMAIRPASTARISRPAKKKGSKALTELWSPNMIGEGYISDAELEDAQVQLMCYQEGVDFQKHRKSPRLHWRRAHWHRLPNRTKQPILFRRQLIGLRTREHINAP
jgi:hypothetical protein